MKHRPLGPARTPVSALGLGGMGMSEFCGTTDDAESLATLARARARARARELELELELGVDLLNIADTYGPGHNESLVGRFLRAGGAARRAQVVVAAKFGVVRASGQYGRRMDNSAAYVRSVCEASLVRLGADWIDFYYCHRSNLEVSIEDLMGSLTDLVRAGKVRQVGLSEVSVETLRRAWVVHPIAAVQSEYALWSRDPESRLLQACAELGTTFVAYSPHGRKFLTGEVVSGALTADNFRKNNPRFSAEAEAEAVNRALVDGLARFAAPLGLTNAQVALAWLLAKHPHVVPIAGTRRVHWLKQNAAAAEVSLEAGQVDALDALFDPARVAGASYPSAGMVGIE